MSPAGSELTPRQVAILLAVVSEYIASGSPVPSKLVQERYYSGTSKATVRNEMAVMERDGYLSKPHTSAGRVPLERTFRLYVNELGALSDNLSREQPYVRGELQRSGPDLPSLLRTCARVLSELTEQPALASEPMAADTSFTSFRLTPVSSRAIRVRYATAESGERELLWEPPAPLRDEEVRSLSRALETALCSRGLGAADTAETATDAKLSPEAVGALLRLLSEDGAQRVYVEGTARLLNYPEFRRSARLQEVLSALAQEGTARALLRPAACHEGLTVLIGSEHGRPRLHDCSLVSQAFHDRATRTGAVAVLGPLRMPYRRAMAAVDCVARELDHVLGAGPPAEQ